MFKHPMDGHFLKEIVLFFIRCLACSRFWERGTGFLEVCRTSLPNVSGSTRPGRTLSIEGVRGSGVSVLGLPARVEVTWN